MTSASTNSVRKIRLSHAHWPDIVRMTCKFMQAGMVDLSEKEKSIAASMDEKECPACNPECDDFHARRIPHDFDTRVIAYFSTHPAFADEDKALIHKAIMSYGDQPGETRLPRLSVHIMSEFRKALLFPYQGLEEKVRELNQNLDNLSRELTFKDEYTERLLGEIAYLTRSIQGVLRKSVGSVVHSEQNVMDAFNRNVPASEIIDLIKTQNRKFIRYLEDESQKASQDFLTGVFNRGAFDHHLAVTFRACQKDRTPLSLLIFDIDHFKSVNDTYGHQAGDEALRFIVDQIRKTIQSEGIFLARYGGEEFTAVLTGYDLKRAASIAEIIRITIAKTPFEISDKNIRRQITLSTGAAQADEIRDTPEKLIDAADEALYKAKNSGRNRVCAAMPGS